MPAVRFLYTLFCNGDEPKFRFARDLDDRLQSRNVPIGTSGDLVKIVPQKVTHCCCQ